MAAQLAELLDAALAPGPRCAEAEATQSFLFSIQ